MNILGSQSPLALLAMTLALGVAPVVAREQVDAIQSSKNGDQALSMTQFASLMSDLGKDLKFGTSLPMRVTLLFDETGQLRFSNYTGTKTKPHKASDLSASLHTGAKGYSLQWQAFSNLLKVHSIVPTAAPPGTAPRLVELGFNIGPCASCLMHSEANDAFVSTHADVKFVRMYVDPRAIHVSASAPEPASGD